MSARQGRSLAAALVVALASATPAGAAETEPHYGWQHPPRDGTAALNAAVDALLQRGLDEVNAAPDGAQWPCHEVALRMVSPLWATAGWFFLGLTRSWPVDVRPASSTEYVEQFLPASTYRDLHLPPFGQLVPHDPVVRVGDVVFGVDKLGHMFTNGARAYARFVAARKAGATITDAERAALLPGVGEEHTILGVWASGIFSFADLEANAAGLRFLRAQCEGPAPALRLVQGRWHGGAFDVAAWVTPCFDEAFEPSAFAPCDGAPMHAAIRSLCPRWHRPDVQERWARLRARRCDPGWRALRHELRAAGSIPDARRWNIAVVCAAAAGDTVDAGLDGQDDVDADPLRATAP